MKGAAALVTSLVKKQTYRNNKYLIVDTKQANLDSING